MKFHYLFQLVLPSLFLLLSLQAAHSQPVNIALNKTVTVNIPSREPYIKDKNPAQLTDGKYAGSTFDQTHNSSALWLQAGALAWRVEKEPIVVKIDLGEVKPISGVAFSTGAGSAGVQFPSFIAIAVSEDNHSWYYQGNLLSLSRKNGAPPLEGYANFCYQSHNLATKGRYVALSIVQSPYTVVDEIEVYAGHDDWLAKPIGGEKLSSLSEVNNLQKIATTALFVQRRIDDDINRVKTIIAQSTLPAPRQNAFMARLENAGDENDRLRLSDADIRTILPINDTHRDVMAIYGEFLGTQNIEAMAVWKQHRYAWLSHLEKPQKQPNMALNFSMLKNQFRSDAFLLTNATGQAKTISIELQNPPAGAGADWLQVHSAAWMDTHQGIPVADALLPIERNGNRYTLTIPAGFTSKIWLIADSAKLRPGTYTPRLRIEDKNIPLRLTVSAIEMPRPRLSLNVWDYTDPKSLQGPASRGMNSKNLQAGLTLMQSHYVDSPEASRTILPWPKAEDFDEHHQLKAPLSFTDFDRWIAQWPHAKQYSVFISAKRDEKFAGAEPGSQTFNARLATWAKALSAHMKSLNLHPGQLMLSIFDEPGLRGVKTNEEWENQVIADWAQPIKASGAGLTLIANPVWDRPDLQKVQSAFTPMDVLMPVSEYYFRGAQAARDYYQQHRANGGDLWLYSCIGPTRLFNPQQYYRGMAWRVFSIGGKGMGFWSFGDIQQGKTTWHDYAISTSFTPAFVDTDTIYNSTHWESVREGVQDFEELSLLKDAISKTNNAELKRQAQEVLDEAVKTVNAAYAFTASSSPYEDIRWYKAKDVELYDQQLANVRAMLEELS